MSLGNAVFLKKAKLPTPAAWAAEIRARGFELEFDPDFELETFSGFLPCRYRGRDSGFEYFYQSVADADLEPDARRRAKGLEVMVTLITHSEAEGLTCAIIASAVLAAMTGGVHWSHEANEFQKGSASLAWAKDADATSLADRTNPPASAPKPMPEQRQVEVQLGARIVFRGAQLLMLETLEPAPRRFTVRLATAALPDVAEVQVTKLWDDGASAPVVSVLIIGGQQKAFDRKGTGYADAPDIPQLLASLGRTEAATRGLLAAGDPAVPGLLAIALDERAPHESRRAAIVILGQIRPKLHRVSGLERLLGHPSLGSVAARAVELIGRND